MKSVPIRDFLEEASRGFVGHQTVAIELDGQTLGYFIPTHEDPKVRRERANAALERFEEALKGIMAKSGLTEDELADLLDPTIPLPEDLVGDGEASHSSAYATRR